MRRSRTFALALVASGLLLCLAPCAWAIVNVEDLRPKAREPGFHGQLAFATTGQSGNTDKSSWSLGARAEWQREREVDFVVFNADYGEAGGVRDTDKQFLHIRHITDADERRAWEAFVQLERNEFTRLSSRSLLGGGLRWTLRQRPQQGTELFAGTGAFYSRERLEPRADTTDAGTDILWRANLYLVVRLGLNESVRLLSTTYYQPALDELADFRALEEVALAVRLNERLDLKLSLETAYDSRPPQLVEKTDITYRSGIEYRF